MEILKNTINMICEIKKASQIKVGRSYADFFTDRIRQAVTESTLFSAVERLSNMNNANIGFINRDISSAFIKSAQCKNADAVLKWIRKNPKITGMIVFIKDEDERNSVLDSIEISESLEDIDSGRAIQRRPFDIGMKLTCATPLAHGGDEKSGNASLFRRMDVLSDTNQILTLPYYAGNAIRGQVRDLLADHFLSSLGYEPRRDKPPVALWFFHALYSGGALSEKSKETTAIMKISGGKSLNAEGIKNIRDMIPALSVLGFAFGNRIVNGNCDFGDLRPLCYQWGNHDHIQSGELIEWVFLTRREDHQGHEEGENSSMIANTECLKAGTQLEGGVDLHNYISDLEKSALAKGLSLLRERGRIGAENRRDLGGVKFEFENLPDPGIYEKFLSGRKQDIIDFLNFANAFHGGDYVSPEGENIKITDDDIKY